MRLFLVTLVICAALALSAELATAQFGLKVNLVTQTKGNLIIGAKETAKVDSLKQIVEENDGIKRDRQALLYGDQVLSGDKLLSDYDMEDYAQVVVALLPPSQH